MATESMPDNFCPAVPDHEILREIGAGSYGRVWLARNTFGQYRAVKVVFRSRFSEPGPFGREFRGIERFEPISRSHPGVIAILHVGRNDAAGYYYYIMELADDVHGAQSIEPNNYVPMTLSLWLTTGERLPVSKCLEIGLALTHGLAHLHNHDLVHRDIKPSNIVFVGNLPKLADIGLVTDAASAKTYVGTEGFIPPEGAGSKQADIYSLGKVLYEAATGRDRLHFPELPTFVGAGADEKEFLELNEVIVRACHPQPTKRYASAEAMSADLGLLVAGKSVRRARQAEHRRELLKKSLCAGIPAVVAVASIASAIHRAQKTIDSLQKEKAELQTQVESSPAASPKITLQPESVEVNASTPVRFTVNASGAGELVYQWFHEGKALPGATNRVLVISNVSVSETGQYCAEVRGMGGSIRSAEASLRLNSWRIMPSSFDAWDVSSGAKIIKGSGYLPVGKPAGMLGEGGQTIQDEESYTYFADGADEGFAHFVEWETPKPVTIRAVRLFAVGDGPDTGYGREFESFVLKAQSPHAFGYDITILKFSPEHPFRMLDSSTWAILEVELPAITARMFRAEFVERRGKPNFNGPRIMELDGFESVPEIIPQFMRLPKSQTVEEGSTVTFSVEARGGNLSFQWEFNGTAIPGARAKTLTLEGVKKKHEGVYSLTVSNSLAAITSEPVILKLSH